MPNNSLSKKEIERRKLLQLMTKIGVLSLIPFYATLSLAKIKNQRKRKSKEIYLIGISHDPGLSGKFTRDSKKYLTNIIKYKYGKNKRKIATENKKFDESLASILKTAKPIVLDNRKALIEIKNTIKHSRISYIGLEFTSKVLKKILRRYNSAYYFYKKLLNVRYRATKSQKEINKMIDDLFLFFYGPVIYLHHKKRFKKIKLVGIEEETSKKAAYRFTQQHKKMTRKFPKGGKAFQNLLGYNLQKIINSREMPMDGEIDNLINIHNSKPPAKAALQKQLKRLLKSFLDYYLIVIDKRDSNITKNIIKLNQNALIIIGDAHISGLKRSLSNSKKKYKITIKYQSMLRYNYRQKQQNSK